MNGPTELRAECDAHDIRLLPDGDDRLTIDAPQDALTPDLVERLMANKAELLAILRADATRAGLPDASETWGAVNQRVDDSELGDLGPDGWPIDSIDPNELEPCPNCGMLELWQTAAGNWRCEHCDPPTKAQELAKLVERIRRRTFRKNATGRNGQQRV